MSGIKYWSVPKIWDGETIVIIGNGYPTKEQVEYCNGKARVICVNDTFRLAPWADVLYFADYQWFNQEKGWWGNEPNYIAVRKFNGTKITIENSSNVIEKDSTIKVLANDSRGTKQQPIGGICLEPHAIRTGRNSGHMAINIAVHYGGKKLILLGFECNDAERKGETHWFGDHEREKSRQFVKRSFYKNTIIPLMKTLVEPLNDLGIDVINATPNSNIPWFVKKDLSEIL